MSPTTTKPGTTTIIKTIPMSALQQGAAGKEISKTVEVINTIKKLFFPPLIYTEVVVINVCNYL